MMKNNWFPEDFWDKTDEEVRRHIPRLPKIRKSLVVGGGLVLLLLLAFPALTEIYTEYLWYSTEGYGSVFWTRIVARIPLFIAGFLATSLILWLHFASVRRTLRAVAPQYDGLLGARPIGLVLLAAALFLGLSSGASVSTEWGMVLRFLRGMPFGTRDAIFGKDIGFYTFGLPFWKFLHGEALDLLLLCLLTAGGAYAFFLMRDRAQDGTLSVPPRVQAHLTILAAAGALLWGVRYWLERYAILYSPRGATYGAGYTDVHAELLALNVLAAISALIAVFLLASLVRKTWKISLGLVALLFLSNIVLRGMYPALVQKYFVEPNEFDRERPYIQNNIEATLKAYDLHDIELRTVVPDDAIRWEDIEGNQDTIRNVRLWDHAPLLRSYKQLQEIRTYYDFSSVDIDRYTVDGEYRQVMLSPRELDIHEMQNPTWINMRLEFTHGYGVVMNPVNEVTGTGQPRLWIRDIPPIREIPLALDRPQIYYGEKPSSYVFVGTTVREFDYPMGDSNVRTAYEGKGGVPMGSFLRRILFAIKFADMKILFSDVFTPDSRILYYQNIRERLAMVAPFLAFDGDPYLVVSGGRLVWMQDAYTTTDRYPYSQPIRLGSRFTINYIRNSVKATVDAYDGTMRFYASDPEDPILQTWGNIFTGLFRPLSEMPGDLRNHLRYPQDLFNIQSEIYRTYHMTDANTFYNKEDVWDRMNSNEQNRGGLDAYYVNMRLAGEDRSEFVLITPFMPVNKNNMMAWMAGRSDGGEYGQLLVYQFPKQKLVYGPSQVEALTNQHPEISAQLSLWSQRGTSVIRGNMTVIPVGNGILYVQPLYLRAENSELPELKRVITSTGGRVVWGETLELSLQRLLGAPQQGAAAADEPSPAPLAPSPGESESLRSLAASALETWENARRALRNEDWEGYGREIGRLETLLKALREQADEQSP